MPIRLNVFCNGQVAATRRYVDRFDSIEWNPGGVKRDALGIPISEEGPSEEREVEENADIPE